MARRFATQIVVIRANRFAEKNLFFMTFEAIRANRLKPAIRNFFGPPKRESQSRGWVREPWTIRRIRRFARICESIRAKPADKIVVNLLGFPPISLDWYVWTISFSWKFARLTFRSRACVWRFALVLKGFLPRDASMRALWSERQNSSQNVSQKFKRIGRLFPLKFLSQHLWHQMLRGWPQTYQNAQGEGTRLPNIFAIVLSIWVPDNWAFRFPISVERRGEHPKCWIDQQTRIYPYPMVCPPSKTMVWIPLRAL